MVIARIFSHWAISVKFPYIILTLIPCRGEVRPKKQNKIIPQETKNSHAAIFYREILRKLQRLHLNATVETLGLWGGAPDWLLGGGLLSAHRHYFVKGPASRDARYSGGEQSKCSSVPLYRRGRALSLP